MSRWPPFWLVVYFLNFLLKCFFIELWNTLYEEWSQDLPALTQSCSFFFFFFLLFLSNCKLMLYFFILSFSNKDDEDFGGSVKDLFSTYRKIRLRKRKKKIKETNKQKRRRTKERNSLKSQRISFKSRKTRIKQMLLLL